MPTTESAPLTLWYFADHQRRNSTSEEYGSRNGHLPPKPFNDRSSNKWYNEKRTSRRSEESGRPKNEYRDYRETSGNRERGTESSTGSKPTQPGGEASLERDVVSVDRDSSSSAENPMPRRRPKARNHSSKLRNAPGAVARSVTDPLVSENKSTSSHSKQANGNGSGNTYGDNKPATNNKFEQKPLPQRSNDNNQKTPNAATSNHQNFNGNVNRDQIKNRRNNGNASNGGGKTVPSNKPAADSSASGNNNVDSKVNNNIENKDVAIKEAS